MRDAVFGLSVFVICVLAIAGCSGLQKIFGGYDPAPKGSYEPLAVTGGSLLVSRGECSHPDMDIIRRRANRAILAMQAAWPSVPIDSITVHSLPVSFSRDPWAGDIKATGIYHEDGRWIELRCGYESVIEHELGHALGHQMGLWCYPTIGHGHGLDCAPV